MSQKSNDTTNGVAALKAKITALKEENAALRDERSQLSHDLGLAREAKKDDTALRERNAALEENTLHVQAELEQRREELVALGVDLDDKDRELRGLKEALDVACDQTSELSKELKEAKDRQQVYARRLVTADEENTKLLHQQATDQKRIDLLKADLLAANNEAARLYDLLSVIRKTAKLAKA